MIKKISALIPLALFAGASHAANATEFESSIGVNVGFSAPFKCAFDTPDVELLIDKSDWDILRKRENITVTCDNIPDKTLISIYYTGRNFTDNESTSSLLGPSLTTFFDKSIVGYTPKFIPMDELRLGGINGENSNKTFISIRNPDVLTSYTTSENSGGVLIGKKEFNTGSNTNHITFTIPSEVAIFSIKGNSSKIFSDLQKNGKTGNIMTTRLPLTIKASDIA